VRRLRSVPLLAHHGAEYSLADKPAFVIGAILAAFGVQLIGFGLVGEIIIFTQAPNLRDYKVEDIVEGGRREAPKHHLEAVPAAAEPAPELAAELATDCRRWRRRSIRRSPTPNRRGPPTPSRCACASCCPAKTRAGMRS
jgi:hypothetical protein